MLSDAIVSDLLLGDSPQIRRESPSIRPTVTSAATSVSPGSPPSPPTEPEVHVVDGPSRIWRVWLGDGEEVDLISGEPITLEEIRREYPNGTKFVPRFSGEEDRYGDGISPACTPTSATVTCGSCVHFQPSASSAAGVGRCLVDAPSSQQRVTWPFAKRHCRLWGAGGGS